MATPSRLWPRPLGSVATYLGRSSAPCGPSEREHEGGLVEEGELADARGNLQLREEAWMVKGGEIGGLGCGSLENPRQWLGAQRAGLCGCMVYSAV